MSSSFNRIKKNIIEAMQSTNNQGTSAYDSVAEVRRVEGDTAWVHIAGGVDETPVKLTIAAKAGDVVQVRVGGGRAWITGNASAPPTDDKTAIAAKNLADIAGNRANTAQSTAAEAQSAANFAANAASAAQTSAATAAQAATTAQSKADSAGAAAISATKSANSAGEAAAMAQAAAKAAQGKIDDQQEFFWHDAMGAHILGSRSDTARYRTDIGSDGLSIKDVSTAETEVASFKATGAVIGKKDETHAKIDSDSFDIIDAAGDTKASLGGKTPIIQIGKFVFINRDNGNLTIKIV